MIFEQIFLTTFSLILTLYFYFFDKIIFLISLSIDLIFVSIPRFLYKILVVSKVIV